MVRRRLVGGWTSHRIDGQIYMYIVSAMVQEILGKAEFTLGHIDYKSDLLDISEWHKLLSGRDLLCCRHLPSHDNS